MISVKHLSKTYTSTLSHGDGLNNFVKNIFQRKYKQTTAVNDISFEIPQGELVGFLGPNGAGKTTTMKMLSGILYPTNGDIEVLGHTPFEKKTEFLKQIAFIMGQRNQLLWELPAREAFKLNKAIYEIPDNEFNKTVEELLSLLDAGDIADQPVKTLSLGQRMKMELTAALLHKPKVLFLDEPTIGLDVVAQQSIRDFIKEYQSRHKATILLTSHYMEDVKHLCKRVIIIDHGSLIYDGELEELTTKYTKHKKVKITVEEMPKTTDLEKIGHIDNVEFPQITFKVQKKELPKLIQEITDKLRFTDIVIEEEKIEDIIRKIFQN